MNLFSGCALRLGGDTPFGLLSVRMKEKLECVCIESGPSTGSGTALVKKNISLGCALRYVLRSAWADSGNAPRMITILKTHSLRFQGHSTKTYEKRDNHLPPR